MMLTRCPACQTVFRLRPEQLDARGGEVRCGHCFHPFNARAHAFEPPTEAKREEARAAARQPPPQVQTQSAQGAPTAPASLTTLDFDIPGSPFDAAQDTPPPAPFDEAGLAPPVTEFELAPPARTEQAAPHFPEVLRHVRRATSNDSDPALDDALRGRPSAQPSPAEAPLPAFDRSQHPMTADSTGAFSSTRAIAIPEPSEAPASPEPPTAVRAASMAQREADRSEPDSAEPDLARLDATYGRPTQARSPLANALGRVLVLLMAIGLGAQAVYLYRTDIARELPGLRPVLEQTCARIGCIVPYPRDAEQIAIEASDLQAEPGKPGYYMLRATLNNRAQYAQQWPHLELTLTDAGDNPISRRVLAPAEWLAEARSAPAFAARRLVDLRIPFETTGIAPTGYRIYAFYP